MNWLKKITAALLMILALLGLLICAAVFIGVWVVNAPLSDGVVETIETVESYFTSIDQTLDRLQTGFAGQQEIISRIQDDLNSTTISDAAVLQRVISEIAGEEMRPAIEGLVSTTRAISEGVLAFNSALTAFNRVPGIDLPTLSEDIASINSRVDSISQDLEQIQVQLSSSEGIKYRLLQPVNDLAAGLKRAETTLAGVKSTTSALLFRLGSLKVSIPRWIDLSSAGVSILFLLFGAGQVLLFEQAWKWFRSISLTRTPETPGAGGETTPEMGPGASTGGSI